MYIRLCNEYENSYKPILDNPMNLYILPYSQQQILILDMGYKLAQFIEKVDLSYGLYNKVPPIWIGSKYGISSFVCRV